MSPSKIKLEKQHIILGWFKAGMREQTQYMSSFQASIAVIRQTPVG